MAFRIRHYLPAALTILFTLLPLTSGQAQFTPLENFDSLTAPNLPLDWRVVTSVPAPPTGANWKTDASLAETPPLAAQHIPVSGTSGKSISLRSRYFRAPSTADVRLHFRHQFLFESGFDGGRFLLDGANSSSSVNCFDGGYNAAISPSNAFLGGQQAWSGASTGFLATRCNITNLAGRFIDLTWEAAYDATVLFPGGKWVLDSIEISPAAKLTSETTVAPSTAHPGEPLTFTTLVTNEGPGPATNVTVRNVLPAGVTIQTANSNFGVTTQSAGVVRTTLPTLPANASVQVVTVVNVQQNPAPSDTLMGADFQQLFHHEFGIRRIALGAAAPVTSTKLWPLKAFDFFGDANDACEGQIYTPEQTAGRIAIITPGTCSATTKALSVQAKGFAAAIIEDPTELLADPGDISPNVLIPVYLMGSRDIAAFRRFSDQDLRAVVSSDSATLVSVVSVAADQYNPNDLHEYQALYIPIDFDRDDDGVNDALDGCVNDSSKSAPGICGCGVPDSDTNANGVIDCRLTAEALAQAQALQAALKRVKNSSPKTLSSTRAKALASAAALVAFFQGSGAPIQPLSGKSSLFKLAKSVKGSVSRIRSANFDATKRSALKSVTALVRRLPKP